MKCEACHGEDKVLWVGNLSHTWREGEDQKSWRYDIVRCPGCGLARLDPLPDWSLLQTFYSPDYGCYQSAVERQGIPRWKFGIASNRYSGAFAAKKSAKDRFKRAFAAAIETCIGKVVTYPLGLPLQLKTDAKIFELGYGSGDWLHTMAELGYTHLHGYDIEANSSTSQSLVSRGVEVSSGVFLDNDYPLGSYDLIRLEHVFEHLLNPVDTLKKCRAMLSPTGSLVMSFPCRDSWSAILSPSHWTALDPPRHIFHHTPASARLILEQAGFRVTEMRPYPEVVNFGSTLNALLQERMGIGLRIPMVVWRILGPVYKLIGSMTRKGDFLTVWAQPISEGSVTSTSVMNNLDTNLADSRI